MAIFELRKKRMVVLYCVIVIFALGGCLGREASLQKMWLEQAGEEGFKAYSGNPIIRPGGMGIWDSWAVMSMSVVKVDGVFHLYYEGGLTGCGDLQIGHATSTDGLHWHKDPASPVLKRGEWDGGATWDPYVIYEDGLFKMWYGGERKGRRDFQCGYAVSKDGVHFMKKGKISNLSPGDIGDMHVFHNPGNGRYYMYYWDRRFGKAKRLRVAVSENETDFDFENSRVIRIEGERPGHRYSHVLKEDDKWYMFYGFDGQYGMGVAVSDDGLNWKAHNTRLGGGEDAEVLRVSKDLYFMFYCPEGLQDEAGCDINLAIYNGSLKELGD